MGTSISSWQDVAAYFTFADNPAALIAFTVGVAVIVGGLINLIIKHENRAFSRLKD
ncbi:MAG: hypothetical protein KTR17_09880 [Cellvibrionaceae bacterium]|nr:hypothetical protein [Cellvibrionaceae bacterium]